MQAVLWMTGTILSFCLMAVGVRELSADFTTLQILALRSIIGLLVISLMIVCRRRTTLFLSARKPFHLLRNLFHFAGQYGWFLGISLLPLAEVFALEFTVPIWTVIIAALFLGEKLALYKVVAVALGMAGVIVVLQPGSKLFDPAAFIVLGAAVCYAISHTCTKALSGTEDPLTILFYMCLVQWPIATVLAGLTTESYRMPETAECLWLLLVGLTALTAHFCITRAMQVAEAGIVVTLDFLRLPLIALIGVAWYSEAFHFSLIIGAGLMLLGNLLNSYYSTRRYKPTAS